METRETKNCPYCGEEILAVAKKCKHCGKWLHEPPQPKQMIPCPICGEEVEEGTEVCPHCKEQIGVDAPVQETVQESRPINRVPQPSVPVTPATTSSVSGSFFKDFMKSKSLTGGLMLLLGAYILTSFLGAIENEAIEILVTGFLIVIGCAMSLLIIQRVANDKNKVDLCSWTAIVSAIAWPIAMYLGRDGINNMGYDVFEFAKDSDTSEGALYLRYMIHCGIVFYVIAQLLELVSKYFMWTTAKPKFKTTIIVGIVACVSFLLFVLCSKSLSQGLLIIWMCLSVFIYVVYFIMILINGSGEGASNPKPQISSAEDTEKAEDDTSEKAILSKSTHNTDSGEKPLSISSVENGNDTSSNINKSEGLNDITKTNAKDESFTKTIFTVIAVAVAIIVIIILKSRNITINRASNSY